MVQNLIKCLRSYKTRLSYDGLDFDADRPLQYREFRKAMAKIYGDEVAFFGPVAVSVSAVPLQELSKEEKELFHKQRKQENDLITKGHGRIHQKIKEIRQNFSKAVTSGTRSGSGKMVFEFYDELVMIWGGSPASEPLPFGVDLKSFEEKIEEDIATDEESFFDTSIDQTEDEEEVDLQGEQHRDESVSKKPPLKRASTPSCIPKLLDNKCKHLE